MSTKHTDWRNTEAGALLNAAAAGYQVTDTDLDALPLPSGIGAATYRRTIRTSARLARGLHDEGLFDDARREAEDAHAELARFGEPDPAPDPADSLTVDEVVTAARSAFLF